MKFGDFRTSLCEVRVVRAAGQCGLIDSSLLVIKKAQNLPKML